VSNNRECNPMNAFRSCTSQCNSTCTSMQQYLYQWQQKTQILLIIWTKHPREDTNSIKIAKKKKKKKKKKKTKTKKKRKKKKKPKK